MSFKKNFKVAHVVYSLDVGGVTNVIKQLLTTSNPAVEQILILLSADTIPQELAAVKTYQLNYVSPTEYSLIGFAKIAFSPGKYFGDIANQLSVIWQKEKFDIFHFHGLPKDLPIGKLLQKKIPSVRLVYTDHLLRISGAEHNSIKGKILAKLYKHFYKPYNTIFVSRATYEIGKEFGFIGSGKQNTFIENSINISAIRQKTDYTISGKPTIVYVSRISAVKGHFLLIEVAKLLSQKHGIKTFVFVLIGPGELTEKLQAEINNNFLAEHFTLLGSRNDIGDLLPTYDLAVFPSEREGLPIALLEKMAAGLPVVASNIPEIKSVVVHPEEALLFPVNEAAACAATIFQLINNEELRRKTGEAARTAVEERYSQPLLEKYLEFYATFKYG